MVKINRLLERYRKLSFKDRLHMSFRIKTVPWEQILNNFPRGNNIIDIGCGHGILINLLAMRDCGYKRMIGIDLAADKIRVAKSTANEQISFHSSDIFDLKENAEVYSIFDVLYLMPNDLQEKLLKHIYNILPKNGYLVLKEVDKKPKWKFLINIIQESISVKFLHLTLGEKFYFKSESDFKELLEKIGFNTTAKHINKGYLHPHILYICQK